MHRVFMYGISILLFAIATAVIYAWGLLKERNQSRDLYRGMLSKGVSKVNKYLKTHEYITAIELQELIKDIKVSQVFSRQKFAVTDKKQFARNLADFMVENHLLTEDRLSGKVIYRKPN